MESKAINCKNCGAPVTSEICPYCGSMTGLNTAKAYMEYPVLECKEVNIGFWNVIFPGIFFVMFGIIGVVMPLTFYGISKNISISEDNLSSFTSVGKPTLFGLAAHMLIFNLPFLIISIVAFVIMIKPIVRFLKVKIHGKKIQGTVYGYMDDNYLLNGIHAQTCKILVQSPEGPRFIMYQLGRTDHPYGVNTKINLYVYNNYFMIDKKSEKIKW